MAEILWKRLNNVPQYLYQTIFLLQFSRQLKIIESYCQTPWRYTFSFKKAYFHTCEVTRYLFDHLYRGQAHYTCQMGMWNRTHIVTRKWEVREKKQYISCPVGVHSYYLGRTNITCYTYTSKWGLNSAIHLNIPPPGACGNEKKLIRKRKQELHWEMYPVYSQTSLIFSPINRVVADTTHVAAWSRCAVTLLIASSPPEGFKSIRLHKNWKFLVASQISPSCPSHPPSVFPSNYLLLLHLMVYKIAFWKCVSLYKLTCILWAFPLRSLICSQKVSLCWGKKEKTQGFFVKMWSIDWDELLKAL